MRIGKESLFEERNRELRSILIFLPQKNKRCVLQSLIVYMITLKINP